MVKKCVQKLKLRIAAVNKTVPWEMHLLANSETFGLMRSCVNNNEEQA
jgi:hypothetical protein